MAAEGLLEDALEESCFDEGSAKDEASLGLCVPVAYDGKVVSCLIGAGLARPRRNPPKRKKLRKR